MNITLAKVCDEELVRRIDAAESSVTLYAPGVGLVVADALCRAVMRLNGKVKIALDVSQKSVDMGFLDPEAVRKIWYAQSELSQGEYIFYHVPGLRLATLFVDSGAPLVFAPFARLMEDDNMPVVTACPSGLEVSVEGDAAFGEDLAQTVVKVGMVKELCDIVLTSAKSLSEIRRENEALREKAAASEKRAAEAEKKIEEAGKNAVEEYKKRFTLRKVEFSVLSNPVALDRRKVTIPSYFLVGMDGAAAAKLQASYKLFPDAQGIIAQVNRSHFEDGGTVSNFEKAVQFFRRRYLIPVKRYGVFIRNKDLAQVEKEVDSIRSIGSKMNNHIQAILNAHVQKAVDALADVLKPQLERLDLAKVRQLMLWGKSSSTVRDLFVATMKRLAYEHISESNLQIKFSTTIVDDSLMTDGNFRNGLCKAVHDRNSLFESSDDRFSIDELLPT